MKKLLLPLMLSIALVAFNACEGDEDPVESGDDENGEENDSDGGSNDNDEGDEDSEGDDDKEDDDSENGSDDGDNGDENDSSGDDETEDENVICFEGDYPEGPYGTMPNDTIDDIEFDDCNGGTTQIIGIRR